MPAERRFSPTKKSTTIRTLKAIGLFVRLLAAVAPRRAEQLVIRLFSTPARGIAKRRIPADADVTFLPFEGRELAIWSLGCGPTVILAHGWAATGDDLLAVAGVLRRAGFKAVCFDMPAHGRSSGRRTDLPQMARAVRAVADSIVKSGDVFAVVGHSLGAAAVTLALRDGLRASSAVLLAPPSAAAEYFTRLTTALGLSADLSTAALRALSEYVDGDLQSVNAADAALQLALPALVVHDRRDREVPWADGRTIADAWKGARLVTTEGLGHRRILSDGAVLESILDFIVQKPVLANPRPRASAPVDRDSRDLIVV